MSAAMLAAGKLVFAVMGVAVGFRLAGTMREQGAWGLHTVALAAICVGGIGLLLMPLADIVGSFAILVAAEAGIRIGMLLLCVFIAGTFRPTPIGWLGAALAGLFLVASIVWDLRSQTLGVAYDYSLASSNANQLSIAVPFAWATVESLLLWRSARRRLELGLATPALVRGYGLWAITTACFVGICVLAIAGGLFAAAGLTLGADLAHAMRGVLYFVLTAAIWLGLFRRTEQAETGDAPV